MNQEPKSSTITLETPIYRSEQAISEIVMRHPVTRDLQGLSLLAILQMDVTTLIELLPRLTTPALTKQDVMNMSISDLAQFATVVSTSALPQLLRGEEAELAS